MEESVVLNAAGGESVDSSSDSEKCYICLSPFEEQTVGSLQSCQHVFCLQCILQWSKTANTCPVDRISFNLIHQRQCRGGDIQKKITVETPKNDDEDEEEVSSPVNCEECGRSDRRHRLLVCTRCDSGYHMNCLRPSLNTGPEGDWICPECATPHPTESTMVDEISDGELTDLLAEVDEVEPASSRLRPSTINHPGRYTERRRHSARIQSRTGGSPSRRPQTSWHVPKYLIRASRPAAAVPTNDTTVNHSDVSNTSIKVKTRKRRKRAA